MLKSEDLRFFSVIAGEQSLAAAARKLDVTPSAVTQRLRGLETMLGLRLTDRTGRGIVLTDEGSLLLARGAPILQDLDRLDESLGRRRGGVAGHLRIIAPFGFGRLHIAPLCASFSSSFPEVAISLQLSDKLGRHPSQPWDIAVHVGELSDSSLNVRKLASHRRLLCASPAYLARMGRPDTPDDLANHDCLVLHENDDDPTLWRFAGATGQVSVRVSARLASNDGEVVRGWALQGLGIAVRSTWSIADDLAAGRLETLLPGHALPDADIVALVGPAQARAERTRRFLAYLEQGIRTTWRA